ncbi:MAG TPA: Mrp/NBP35 family ATP-binding protein [Firmicutes bacterium]|mgnify:FL=1|nr:Mrp/NBP35 family ATP-binding protein [Bacillota bacterium]
MSETCNHQCSSCGQDCGERTAQSLLAKANPGSRVKKIIGVVSGKGGVGKSLITSLLASAMTKKGYACGVLDADVTGPSIPKVFGVHEKATAVGNSMVPVASQGGVRLMSVNLILEDETDPVIWRGPLIAGVVQQFWTEVMWGDLDYLFVDMPPGTGDVALTVFQSLPVDGIIVVTSPQDLVSMIVSKAVKMAQKMDIPILGVVENMSYVRCPDCGKKILLYGESHVEQTAKQYGLSLLGQLPIDPAVAKACDEGKVETVESGELQKAVEALEGLLK